jgi:RES domain-containing protein
MAQFLVDSYRRFEQSVKRKARYVYDDEVNTFLSSIIANSEKRKESIAKDVVLWRAQRGYEGRKENEGEEYETEVPAAYSPERMRPNAEFVCDGRVNPRGIPCLYLASTPDTAMAEIRPWVGSYISLAQFKVMRDLVVVDCSQDKRIFPIWLVNGKPVAYPAEKCEGVVWGDIAYALSRPVTPDEPLTEYVPTQVLAEAFRLHGYDGIVYKSLLAKGANIALFHCEAAELINCGLYKANAISFMFDQADNPYFISKHYPNPESKAAANPESAQPLPAEIE